MQGMKSLPFQKPAESSLSTQIGKIKGSYARFLLLKDFNFSLFLSRRGRTSGRIEVATKPLKATGENPVGQIKLMQG